MIIAIVAQASGKQILMEFHLFQSLLFQVGGRGGETATRCYRHLCTKIFYADGMKSIVLGIQVKRDKNNVEDFHRIFPQADINKWWDDFTFILALTTMLKCDDHSPPSCEIDSNNCRDRMFFNFYENSVVTKANNKEAGTKKNRSVSRQWKVVFNKVLHELEFCGLSAM